MTTYGKMLELLATLQEIKAGLKYLALHNTKDLEADEAFLQGAAEVNALIRELEERRRELLVEEPQFAQEDLTPTSPKAGKGDQTNGETGT